MRPRSETIVSVIVVMIFLAISCTGGETATPFVTLSPSLTLGPPESTNTSIPTVVEPGLAHGIPCRPPCWQGLTPSESTAQESAKAMEQLRAIGWANSIDGDVSWGYHIYPSAFTTHGSIHVNMNDGIVAKINGTTLFYYTVGTLVEQFGAPERIYLVSKGGIVCSSCEEWEPSEPPTAPVMSSPVHLLYPNQGLWFLILVPLSGLGCICPEMKVVTFCYYAPVSMPEALNDNYLADLCAGTLIGVTEEDLVEWHGFGGGY